MSALENAEASQLQLDIVACNSLPQATSPRNWGFLVDIYITGGDLTWCCCCCCCCCTCSMFAILEKMLVSNGWLEFLKMLRICFSMTAVLPWSPHQSWFQQGSRSQVAVILLEAELKEHCLLQQLRVHCFAQLTWLTKTWKTWSFVSCFFHHMFF